MSGSTFALVLAGGAGLLAMWVHVRFPALKPEKIGRAIVHAALAFALLKVSSTLGDGATAFVAVFVFILPALTYALLCTIWVLHHAQAALGLSR
jgi:hypothetical protein